MAGQEDKKGQAPEAPDRRSFLQDSGTALAAAIVLAAAPAAAAKSTQDNKNEGSQPLIKATSYKVEKWNITERPDGREAIATFVASGPGGETARIPLYARWIYYGEKYSVIHHIPSTPFTRGVTVVVSGTKGVVDGDIRRDVVSAIAVEDDGGVHREGPQEVKVRLKDPYTGLSVQEKVNQFMVDKAAGRWN